MNILGGKDPEWPEMLPKFNKSHFRFYLLLKITNFRNMVRRGRSCRGTRHGASKLTKEQVLQIIKMDGSQSKIAKVFGITQSYVSELKLGKKWGYLRATT